MFGRLPWLALERRIRALRFLVFFDIGVKAIGQQPERHKANLGRAPHVIASRIGLAILIMIGTDIRGALILTGQAKLGLLAPNSLHFARPIRPSGNSGGNGCGGDDGSQRCG